MSKVAIVALILVNLIMPQLVFAQETDGNTLTYEGETFQVPADCELVAEGSLNMRHNGRRVSVPDEAKYFWLFDCPDGLMSIAAVTEGTGFEYNLNTDEYENLYEHAILVHFEALETRFLVLTQVDDGLVSKLVFFPDEDEGYRLEYTP